MPPPLEASLAPQTRSQPAATRARLPGILPKLGKEFHRGAPVTASAQGQPVPFAGEARAVHRPQPLAKSPPIHPASSVTAVRSVPATELPCRLSRSPPARLRVL